MALKPLQGKGRAVLPLADRRINLWEGAVRSSKTVGSILKWIEYSRTAPPGNLLMVGKTERTLQRNILDPIITWLGPKRAHLVAGSGEFWLCGRKIYLAGANDERAQDKIRGLTLTGAYVDEASLVPESFWTMLLSRLSEPGARLYATTNPDGPFHWLKAKYLDRASLWVTGTGETLRYADPDRLDLARFSFTLDDNPYLDRDYVASLKREYVGLWYRRFIEGAWVLAQGSVFDMFDPARQVVAELPEIRRWLALGIDYGTVNPTAALILAAGVDGVLYLSHEWRHDSATARRQLTDADLSREIRDWLGDLPVPGGRGQTGIWPEWTVVDPSAASLRLQLHRDGMTPALADNDVLDGIRLVASLLGQGVLKIHKSCAGLLAEIPGYSWDDKAAERGEDAPVKANDHSIDAARYAVKTSEVLWRPLIRTTTPGKDA